jgi:3-deoxy-D-manno-octulosonic-acid transferase
MYLKRGYPLNNFQTVVYNTLQWFIIVVCLPILIPFALLQSKRKQTFFKRLGFQKIPEYQKSVWVHALSVGEVLSAFPIIEAMREKWPNKPIVFSASTLSGYEMAQNIRNQVNEIIYYPYDIIFSARWVTQKVNPSLFVLVESDIWPNFLTYLYRKKIPSILLNARLSKESYKGYRLLRWFMQPALLTFSGICTQSKIQKRRFETFDINSSKICVSGNVKFDQKRHQISQNEMEALKKESGLTGTTPVIVAGSTHAGEEKILIEVFFKLIKQYSNLKMIIVPRDPNRAKDVLAICSSHQLSASLYSQQKRIENILIVDQMGILGKLYALAHIAFVGGSMIPEGGHNPLEPASVAKPVVFGADMHDFPEVSRRMINEGAAFQVQDSNELFRIFCVLLDNTNLANQCGNIGLRIVKDSQGAVQKSINFMVNYL